MFEGEAWYEYLDETVKELVDLAYYLWDREKLSGEGLSDYSFIVFPMAKGYEGFVKKYLLDLGLIDEKLYKSRHFRIGRSLNPALPEKYRGEDYLYDDLERMCEEIGGEVDLAKIMWEAWRKGRNRIFHFFVGKERMISLEEAGKRIEDFTKAMKTAVECKNQAGR